MSILTAETGAGIPGANSYASIAEADDFHALRGNAAWATATATAKTAALVQATDYLEAFYRPLACSYSATQGLQWPVLTHTHWTSSATLPPTVKGATIVLALYSLASPLSSPATRGIKSEDKTLEGVGESATVYDDAPSDPYPQITAMLDGIAAPKGAGAIFVGRLN